jgi:hypothetical protein
VAVSCLPGHAANAAYWFDDKNGTWITSTYYMNDLPQWVKDFNAKGLPEAVFKERLEHPCTQLIHTCTNPRPTKPNTKVNLTGATAVSLSNKNISVV